MMSDQQRKHVLAKKAIEPARRPLVDSGSSHWWRDGGGGVQVASRWEVGVSDVGGGVFLGCWCGGWWLVVGRRGVSGAGRFSSVVEKANQPVRMSHAGF